MSKKKNTLLRNTSILMAATIISRVIGLLYRSPLGETIGNASDRNEGGGERHRGMTSGQHDPKQPHKNTKAPGQHEATRTREMT